MTDRERLTRELADLCDDRLPEQATGGWAVCFDHCFRRIAYDNAIGAKWDAVVGSPFVDEATTTQLALAVGVARAMDRGGQQTVAQLNDFSLQFRTE